MKIFNFIFALIILCNNFLSYSQTGLLISNQGGTASAIVSSMIGSGLAITNATITCPSNAYGTFTNGSSTNIGIPSGVILTTGNVNNLKYKKWD